MSIEEFDEVLDAWFDHVLDAARKYLIQDDQVISKAFILASKMEIDEYTRKRCLNVDTYAPVQDDGSTPNEMVILILNLPYSDPEFLISCIKYLAENPEKSSEEIDKMLHIGRTAFRHENPEEIIVRVFKQKWGCQDKDIVAQFLKKMCKNLDAIAIVKVDEIWHKRETPPEGEGPEAVKSRVISSSLEDDQEAGEALMAVLETRKYLRMKVIPFYRTERGTGKVTDFGSPREEKTIFGEPGGTKFGGRFMGLLPGFEERAGEAVVP